MADAITIADSWTPLGRAATRCALVAVVPAIQVGRERGWVEAGLVFVGAVFFAAAVTAAYRWLLGLTRPAAERIARLLDPID